MKYAIENEGNKPENINKYSTCLFVIIHIAHQRRKITKIYLFILFFHHVLVFLLIVDIFVYKYDLWWHVLYSFSFLVRCAFYDSIYNKHRKIRTKKDKSVRSVCFILYI